MKINFKISSLYYFVVLIVSFIVFLIILAYNSCEDYSLLFLLPLTFFICSILFHNIYLLIPKHFGITLLLLLEFFRTCILSLVFMKSDFVSKFYGIADIYGNKAILLTTYETIAIFLTIYICVYFNHDYCDNKYKKNEYVYNEKRIKTIILFLLLIFIGTIILAPSCLLMYKNPISIIDVNFTSLEGETYSVVSQYGTSFITKLAMVIHVYLMKILRFMIPLHFIIRTFQTDVYNRKYNLCIFFSFLSFLIIDGSIARSFVYCLVFMYTSALIYKKYNKIYLYITAFSSIIFLYFLLRMFLINSYENNWMYFSTILNAYFSGIPNTAGNIVLTLSFPEIFTYFLCDYLQAIPFGNTIFGIGDISFQNYYNSFNGTYGQIPTTIGTGYNYFGALLSPLYSITFTYLTYCFGCKAIKSKYILETGIYSFATISCAMGVVMYYIQIAISSLVTVVIPIWFICRISKTIKPKF